MEIFPKSENPLLFCESRRVESGLPKATTTNTSSAMASTAAAGSSTTGGEEAPGSDPAAVQAATADAFADGLMGLLTPLVHKCDEGVQQALDSQAALSQQIDRVRPYNLLWPLALSPTFPLPSPRIPTTRGCLS